MLRVLDNAAIKEMEDEKAKVDEAVKAVDSQPSPVLPSLASYVRNCFDRAKQAKQHIERQIFKNKRQKKGEYEPDKLAAIRAQKSSEIFMMITDVKCRHAKAWIRDILFQPGTKPWAIEPTPLPEVPPWIEERVRQAVMQDVLSEIMQQSAMAGQPLPAEVLPMMVQARMDIITERIQKDLIARAKEIAEKMEVKINDQLVEGEYYKALDESIPDIILHTGFVKGPIYVKEKNRVLIPDPFTGRMNPTVKDKILPKFQKVDPLDIYPAPDSNGIDDGYLIEKASITGDKLSALIGVPTYSESEIRSVLSEYGSGGLREWTGIETERAQLENKDPSVSHDSDKIDCLIFNGSIQGRLLLEWGIDPKEASEPELFYPATVYLIGTHVIKAVINDDPRGKKPYSKASWDETDGGFWGRGLPEIISDVQEMCNAAARNIVNNMGMAAGPMTEINEDRCPNALEPQAFRVWRVSQDMMGSPAPAIRVYQINMVADKLMLIYDKFSKVADEHSGVPAYAHGDAQVGGAGNTASGLSMLLTSASRGIKDVIKTMDNTVIAGPVERQYYDNVGKVENAALVADFKIQAKGSSSLIAKEQQAVRRAEFMKATANQFDYQLMGPEGRKYLLKETARAQELDADKAVPDGPPPSPPGAGTIPLPLGSMGPGSPATLGPSGEPVAGQDFRLFNGGAIPHA